MSVRCCEERPGPFGVEAAELHRMLAAAALENARPPARRSRLYELDATFHCSVIGTCFGLGELRRLLGKIGDVAPGSGDHDIHHAAVLIAARRDQAGKLLSKALDKKFKATINRLAAARDATALGRLWDEAAARGDVPEAYWAVLTHPAATPGLTRRVFGEVHMLSHLVGAANRADVRRLQALEREHEALAAKHERQQRHLAVTVGAKERRIRELERLLASRVEAEAEAPDEASGALVNALRREARRRARLERRVETLERRLAAAGAKRTVPTPTPIAEEPPTTPAVTPAKPRMPALAGATLLLVGGRPAQVPTLARAVADAGGALLHHDGGTEMSLSQLSGLASRADRIVVALDCVSHAAADAARRLARDAGKPVLPLPGLSLTSLARALDEVAAA